MTHLELALNAIVPVLDKHPFEVQYEFMREMLRAEFGCLEFPVVQGWVKANAIKISSLVQSGHGI